MKKFLVAALALSAAATFVTPASAAAPSDTDLLCGFTSATDPNPEAPENQQTGEIDGGPIAQDGVITCTIKVGANKFHSSPVGNGAQVDSPPGSNGVTVLSPTLVSYTAEPLENVYLCDQFKDAGGTVYVFDDVDGAWEAAAGNSTAECRLAISASTEDPLIVGIEMLIDSIICMPLGTVGSTGLLNGPVYVDIEGDIFIGGTTQADMIWDCPIYVGDGDAVLNAAGTGPGTLFDLN